MAEEVEERDKRKGKNHVETEIKKSWRMTGV